MTCDEQPEAQDAGDGGCFERLLTYDQALALARASADRAWLLGEVDRLQRLIWETR